MKGSAYTDSQVATPFLCDTCEEILSKNGERTVCGECYRGNGKFILRDKVKATLDMFTEEGKGWINPIKEAKNLDFGAYLYFGASIIWRASAGKWPDYIGKMRGSLGDRYQEELRRFLLGETGFPSKIYLLVGINNDEINGVVA
ncbi:MAG: hypothetical protein OXH81_09275 [Gemmatimonadetes bacterium]|nr:hypothetical protein [Gemmatimonadota bacterium]